MSANDFILFVVPVIVGLIGAPTVFQWVKKLLGAEDKWAVLVVILVAFGLGALALFVEGSLGGAAWAPENLMATFGLIFTAATFAYKVLMGSPDAK
jgi:F0F1-type ATP synthase assembly protein I